MTTPRNYTNVTPTELVTTISSNTTDIEIVSSTGFPSVPFTIGIDRGTINQEVCLVTAVSGNYFTVIRGWDGAISVAHAVNAIVEMTSVAQDWNDANSHITNVTRDDHLNYLRTDGIRHNNFNLHQVGTSINTGIPANSNFGDDPSMGVSINLARADHVHAREQIDSSLLFTVGMIYYPPPLILSTAATNTNINIFTVPFEGTWLACDGSSLSVLEYPLLYGVIGLEYTATPVPGFFKLPSFSGATYEVYRVLYNYYIKAA
jgi:hypothetical protein